MLVSLFSSQPLPGRHKRADNSFPDLFVLSLWGEVAGSRVGPGVSDLVLVPHKAFVA